MVINDLLQPLALTQWLSEHREDLKPPVSNKVLWEDADFIVMVVGGPNCRGDFHVDPAAEIFFQLEGTMVLKVRDKQNVHAIKIPAGQLYILPANTPHCPQRPAHSIGLVIERKRKAHEKDGFQWYCDSCGEKIYECFLQVVDIEKQLASLIEDFYADPQKSTCPHCGQRALIKEYVND